MPELPEVETVRRGLLPHLEGKQICSAKVFSRKLRQPIPDNFEEILQGSRIITIERRAKYLLFDLQERDTLVVHLGMTGSFHISGVTKSAIAEKHRRWSLQTEMGQEITFCDPRRFGLSIFVSKEALAMHPLFKDLGPEPLSDLFDLEYFRGKLSVRKVAIKQALLDQKLVAGIGNIYASEALHRARINPERRCNSLSKKRTTSLVKVTKEVLSEAIDAGGSTLRDHRQISGELGYFQHNFQVYGREGEDCLRANCGGTVKKIIQGARSSFFCPKCQQ